MPPACERFPGHFERYYADHIGLRDAMIRLHAGLHLGLFGASPSERVPVGQDGWLFLGDHASFYDPERIVRRPFAFEIPGSGLPRAVMFRDSFSRALLPFVSEHFERILYVWSPDFLRGPVVDEEPQILIQELAERALARAPGRF